MPIDPPKHCWSWIGNGYLSWFLRFRQYFSSQFRRKWRLEAAFVSFRGASRVVWHWNAFMVDRYKRQSPACVCLLCRMVNGCVTKNCLFVHQICMQSLYLCTYFMSQGAPPVFLLEVSPNLSQKKFCFWNVRFYVILRPLARHRALKCTVFVIDRDSICLPGVTFSE